MKDSVKDNEIIASAIRMVALKAAKGPSLEIVAKNVEAEVGHRSFLWFAPFIYDRVSIAAMRDGLAPHESKEAFTAAIRSLLAETGADVDPVEWLEARRAAHVSVEGTQGEEP